MRMTKCAANKLGADHVFVPGAPLQAHSVPTMNVDANVHYASVIRQIIIVLKQIQDPADPKSRYDYTIELSLEDVAAIIEALAKVDASDAGPLKEKLANRVPALVKILACATGAIQPPSN